ncbi:hypothetical protein BGP_1219 [Beggiatoa sp. PS]|nr:hypothetical protein BGP_1219 [Beggiatoa sp. PS]
MNFHDFIASLTQEDLETITREFNKLKNEIPIYPFSQIEHKDLKKLFEIERIFYNQIFDSWFNSDIILKDADILFLTELLAQEINFIRIYNEEDLKVHFVSPILNKVNFKSLNHKIRDFYEETLTYETNDFILRGVTDFVVAKGLEYPEKPYFLFRNLKKDFNIQILNRSY